MQAEGQANNGVVYAIDRVLIPPVFGNIVATIQGIPILLPTASFKLLQAAVTKAGIGEFTNGDNTTHRFCPDGCGFQSRWV